MHRESITMQSNQETEKNIGSPVTSVQVHPFLTGNQLAGPPNSELE